MHDIQAILERLITARKNAGLSQSQVAKMLGLSPTASSFQPIESGTAALTFERFLALCEIYEIDVTWAITGINPAFDPQLVIEAMNRLKASTEETVDLLELLASQGQR